MNGVGACGRYVPVVSKPKQRGRSEGKGEEGEKEKLNVA